MNSSEQKIKSTLTVASTLKDIVVDGKSLHYLVAGKGDPILLIHGVNIGWGQWYKNIDSLAKHHAVYALDLPGSGHSTALHFKTSNPAHDFVDTVEAFVNELKLKNVTVIGHSIGGWVALKLALAQPKRIKKVVLVNSLGFDTFIPHQQKPLTLYPLAVLLSKTVMKPTKKGVRMFLASAMQKPEMLEDIFVDYYHEVLGDKEHPLMLMNSLSENFKIKKSMYLSDSELGAITQPTHIIMGKNDPLMSIDRASRRFSLIKKSNVSLLAESGHVPFLEEPEAFNNLLNRSLND